MMIRQIFKTLDGAQKRCDFENGVQKKFQYRVEWFYKGKCVTRARAEYPSPLTYENGWHWQLNKMLMHRLVGHDRLMSKIFTGKK